MDNKVEVWRNGKTVHSCSSQTKAWNYVDSQIDKDIAKYAIFDAR